MQIVKYSKLYESVILPQGYKLLIHYFKGKYYILPEWDLLCDISNKGYTLLMESTSIKELCNNITKMLNCGVEFAILEKSTYNNEVLKKHYNEIK